VNCPSCGTPSEPGQKFCGECGARLAQTCAACGTTNSPTARFCGECGNPLVAGATAAAAAQGTAPPVAAAPSVSAVASAAVAERRLVTVLFADLVGFTTLSEGRDPEEVRELLSKYFEMARDTIERYGGIV
jgi:class 3 adenylate cyclase